MDLETHGTIDKQKLVGVVTNYRQNIGTLCHWQTIAHATKLLPWAASSSPAQTLALKQIQRDQGIILSTAYVRGSARGSVPAMALFCRPAAVKQLHRKSPLILAPEQLAKLMRWAPSLLRGQMQRATDALACS
jgi:hypothetical protein